LVKINDINNYYNNCNKGKITKINVSFQKTN